jgi:vacuolar-type H+-ATPase subunit H
VLRLSELLERIRPAGAPGAAAEGDEQHRRHILDAEVADIARVLAAFEQEADQLVADARKEADQLHQEGDRRAEQIRAGLADRVAVAQAAAIERQQTDSEHDSIVESTRRDAERLRADAAARLPELVDTVLRSIWSNLPSEGRT